MNARQINPDQTPTSDERQRRQRARNWAILLALAAFVVIVYIVTIVRMKGG
jgi:predicted nucleic acid-binding Zn ribbon protein